jgi:hypothetical protein
MLIMMLVLMLITVTDYVLFDADCCGAGYLVRC